MKERKFYKHRLVVLLSDAQMRELAATALIEGKEKSALVRECLQAGLGVLHGARQPKKEMVDKALDTSMA